MKTESYLLNVERPWLGPLDIEDIATNVSISYMLCGNGLLHAGIKSAFNGKTYPMKDARRTFFAKYWPTFGMDSMIADLARAYPDFNTMKALKALA